MGLRTKRLKGGGKGQKWKKGQSCVSNPATTKYRSQANKGFFDVNVKSGLTKDAVAEHQSVLASLPTAYSQTSQHSMAMSETGIICPSVLSIPRTLTSAKISIGYCPPPKHNDDAPKTVIDLQQEMEDMSVNEDDDLKSQAKTFATRFTTCSLPAFENFFNNLSVKSEHQVTMLAFHATIQETIKEKQLPETPTSYFVAIIMSLEGMLDDPEQMAAGLALLVRVIKSVPLTALRGKSQTFGIILNTVINKFQTADNVKLLSHVLGCLSILLRAQHVGLWYKDDQLKTWLKNILVFTMHDQPIVRKSGQYNVSAVLKGSEFMFSSNLRTGNSASMEQDAPSDDEDSDQEYEACNVAKNTSINGAAVVNGTNDTNGTMTTLEIHPAADLVADFLIGQLQSSGSMSAAANKSLLHMLVFTRQVITAMPKHKLQIILRRLFGLVSLARGLINTTIMKVLQVLCSTSPPAAVLPLTLTNNILNTLTKHTEGVSSAVIAAPHDMVAVGSWTSVVTPAVQHALKLDVAVGINWCSKYCNLAQQYWRSNSNEVLMIMKQSLSTVLGSVYDGITTINSKEHEDGVRKIIQELEAALSYQYQGAWPFVFGLLGQCYSELGLYYAPMMIPSLKILSELMASNKLACVRELEKSIGMAVQGLGVEAVVCAAPIVITGDINKDEKNLWLLPLLHKFIRNSRLMFFKSHFIPLAEICFKVTERLEKATTVNKPLVQTYNNIQYQIWRLMPSFANQAQDVEAAQTNKSFAKLICSLIENSDDSRLDAMATLRHMITSENSTKFQLTKNSINYIPALFNVFMKEPKNSKNLDKHNVVDGAHRMAAYATIIAYLKITSQEASERFIKTIIEKYKGETKSEHRRKVLLQLARCFVPYISANYIEELYEIIKPLIENAKDKRKQKAAYRVLEEFLSAASPGSEEFVDNQLSELTTLLLSNVKKTAVCSRAPKLRCAKVVLNKVSSNSECESREEFLRSVVGECVVCCGRTNSRAARLAAFTLLADLPPAMKRISDLDDDTTVRECMRLLSCGLLERPAFCANTIIAITAYTYQSQETMPLDILQQNVQNMCTLLECASREVVQACLSFVKGVVALYPAPILGPFLSIIVNGIVKMTPDCARKYRLKTKSIFSRLMRKFGDTVVCNLVPAKCVTLHKRLRNMRKEANRARRVKEREEEEQEQEEDGEEELFTEKAPTSLDEILAEIDPDIVGQDEDDEEKQSKKHKRKNNAPATAWVEENDSEDEILDLLGDNAANAIMTKKPRQQRDPSTKEQKREEENGGFSIDPVSGKLIITDIDKEGRREKDTSVVDADDIDDMMEMRSAAMTGKISNKKRAREDDEDSIDLPMKTKGSKKQKFDYGAEFRSKKCKGDVVKKGQTTKPYAYVQLSKERLNKRKQAKYEGQFKSVVKGAKKGVRQGTKLRKSGKKNKVQ